MDQYAFMREWEDNIIRDILESSSSDFDKLEPTKIPDFIVKYTNDFLDANAVSQ